MNNPANHIPLYLQMIEICRNAFNLLDDRNKEEVFQFILNQQNSDGGFNDRGEKSDLYYSLFGGILLFACADLQSPGISQPVSDSVQKLKIFIEKQSQKKIRGLIEICCLALLQKELKTKLYFRLKTMFLLLKSFWRERKSINLSYRSFVFFITMEVIFKFQGAINFGVRQLLKRTTINADSPCSEVAAKVVMQKSTRHEQEKYLELLQSYASEAGGFRAFSHLNQPDMLSTAVALFALKFAGNDLRLLKPAMLIFIQENYTDGAFLSGDGDLTCDLEYTFYGLLALGVLDS